VSPRHPATAAVRGGVGDDTHHGAVIPPLHLSSTFGLEGLGRKRTHTYTRSSNPTRDLLASTLAELEGGCRAVVTSSGMSAVALVLHLLGPDDLLVAPHDGYGGVWRLLDAYRRQGRLRVELADLTDPTSRRQALAEGPRMVWVETPSNPLLRITDLAAVRREASDALLVVDNTFCSPRLQHPIAWGADLVVHSTTKYLNGHSDVVGGAVVAADAALGADLVWWANCLGVTGAPFDSWLTLRGVRTLAVRMAEHLRNAQVVVDTLLTHPAVARVYWPGLPDHPGHAVAARQQEGFGAIVSFEVAGEVAPVLEKLRCFSLAESLGGVESLVAHPATMTHASMSADARRAAGISDQLVRLSVGIEDPRDLVADLRQALDATTRDRHIDDPNTAIGRMLRHPFSGQGGQEGGPDEA
jgi:cystathionine gamma-synthase